jgi:tetratricopeptide (TPR) repeat protein
VHGPAHKGGRLRALRRSFVVWLLVWAVIVPILPGRTVAQAAGEYSKGDPVLVVPSRLPVYVQPSLSSTVVTEMLAGMKSRVLADEVDADGQHWYYLANLAFGWVPAVVDGLPSVMPFSDMALDKMLAEATAAIEANPDDIEAYLKLGTVYLMLYDYESAAWNYLHAVERAPDDGSLYEYVGKVDLDSLENARAEQDFLRAIEHGHCLPNTYNRLAITYQNRGMYDEAKDYYQRAIDLEPGYGLVYNNLANVFSNEGDQSTAYDLYSQAIRIDPHLAIAYVNRGGLFTQSDFEAATEDFNHAIAIDPNEEEAYAHRGMAYLWIGEQDLAMQDLKHAIALNPRYEFAVWNLAAIYGAQGLYEGVVETYTRVIDIGGRHCTQAFLFRAQAYLMLGQADLALNDIDFYIGYHEAVGNWRSDFRVTAYMTRAAAHLHLAGTDQTHYTLAGQDYAAAFGIDPDMASNLYTTGDAYGVMFANDSAINSLKAQIAVDPNNSELRLQLMIEDLQCGRFREALDSYQQYSTLADDVPPELEQFVTTIADLIG